MDVVYTTVSTREEVAQILDLQSNNLAFAIPPQVALSEGFLTVRHDPDVLWRMNLEKPSIIAKNRNCVVGYALIMPLSYSSAVPILNRCSICWIPCPGKGSPFGKTHAGLSWGKFALRRLLGGRVSLMDYTPR